MKKYTKEEAISIVVLCTGRYKVELDGKNLLFVCTDRQKQSFCFEFSFYGNNYMHLTGLKPCEDHDRADGRLSANNFYQKCLDHNLSPSDFTFSEDGTTHLKLDVLPHIICKNLHASMLGDYDSSKPRLYTEKLVGNTCACMGFTFDKKTCEYVPNTVVSEDIRNLASNNMRVIAVFRKDIGTERYEELTYTAKKVAWESIKLPEEYSYLPLPHKETVTA